jgi:hypothetical protein
METLKAKDIDSVVDGKIRQILKERMSEFSGNEKNAFNNLQENPIWLSKEKNIAVKTVRLFTGLKAAEPIKRNPDGEPIGFVKPGNIIILPYTKTRMETWLSMYVRSGTQYSEKSMGFPSLLAIQANYGTSFYQENSNLMINFLINYPTTAYACISACNKMNSSHLAWIVLYCSNYYVKRNSTNSADSFTECKK